MRGLGPERSNEWADIGAPHSGHGRSVRTGSGVVSYGPTEAGPARRMSREFTHAYQPPSSRTRVRSDGREGLPLVVMFLSVLTIRGVTYTCESR